MSSEHRLVYADPHLYSAHPHGVRLACGAILVVFNRAPRRSVILHPPQDPYFENVLIRSDDEGRSWSAPAPAPGFAWTGVECAGLTALRSGRVILNQWRFRWYSLALARQKAASERIAFPRDLLGALQQSPELDSAAGLGGDPERAFPWARGPGQSFVHLSDDGGAVFERSVAVDTAPFSGGYGMRGAVELADGTLVLPLCDIPEYRRVFVVHSGDGGLSWSAPILVAEAAGLEFEEPAPLLLPSGRIILLLRENRNRTLFSAHSDDGGLTWSRPAPTGIDGYPAHLLSLGDGRILCTYGVRRPPFMTCAVISEDGGETWGPEPLVIRAGLPNKDLGYPFTISGAGETLHTIYYCQDADGVTGIWQSSWALE